METFLLAALLAFAGFVLKSRAERRRILLLGRHLGHYEIEKLMATLHEGYMRALGENDAARRDAIWQLLGSTEDKLCAQFNRFAADFAKVPEAEARVIKLPWPLSELVRKLPAERVPAGLSFDMRQALALHAQGMARAASRDNGLAPQSRAFTLSAELFLMQHSCHWFCKSKAVASARLLVQHKTPYAKLLASVSPETLRAYSALVGEA